MMCVYLLMLITINSPILLFVLHVSGLKNPWIETDRLKSRVVSNAVYGLT